MRLESLPAICLSLLILGGCSTTARDDAPDVTAAPPAPLVQPQVSDPKMAQLEASVLELTERIDVLNERIGKVEAGADDRRPAANVAVAESATPPAAPRPQPVPRKPSSPAAQAHEVSPLRGAMIADSYRNALMLYGRNNFAGARDAFQHVFDAEPSGELADNALYWIGETYYVTGAFTLAMKYYRRVVDEFAEQNKAPDAMFKMGLVYEKIGDLLLARNSFEQLIARYPYSTPAGAARSELKRIKY